MYPSVLIESLRVIDVVDVQSSAELLGFLSLLAQIGEDVRLPAKLWLVFETLCSFGTLQGVEAKTWLAFRVFKGENPELSPVEVGQIVMLQYADDPVERPLEELTVNLLLLIRHQLVCRHLLVVRRKPLHAFKASAYALEVFLRDQASYLLFEWQRLVSLVCFECSVRRFVIVLPSHVVSDGL